VPDLKNSNEESVTVLPTLTPGFGESRRAGVEALDVEGLPIAAAKHRNRIRGARATELDANTPIAAIAAQDLKRLISRLLLRYENGYHAPPSASVGCKATAAEAAVNCVLRESRPPRKPWNREIPP